MPRAVETARIAAALLGVTVTLHDELGEVGVESEIEVVDRVSTALAAIADLYRGEAVLVIGHQAALGLALARMLRGRRRSGWIRGRRWRWSTTRTAGAAERKDRHPARKNTHSAGDETRLGLPKCSW